MEKRWIKKHSDVAGTISKEAYDLKVELEAIKRVGKNVNLKGVVHEIMVKDRINLNPKNILTGTRASLTKSSTQVRDMVASPLEQNFALQDGLPPVQHEFWNGGFKSAKLLGKQAHLKKTLSIGFKKWGHEDAREQHRRLELLQTISLLGLLACEAAFGRDYRSTSSWGETKMTLTFPSTRA